MKAGKGRYRSGVLADFQAKLQQASFQEICSLFVVFRQIFHDLGIVAYVRLMIKVDGSKPCKK